MYVVDGSSFETAGRDLARILNEGYPVPVFTPEQIIEILSLRISNKHLGGAEVEFISPQRCTGIEISAADYEGYPIGADYADYSDVFLVNERAGNQLPAAALYWSDVEVMPSFPHSI